MTSSHGLVTDFHRNRTYLGPEELELVQLKEDTGQMEGSTVVNHLPFDQDDHEFLMISYASRSDPE